MDKFKKWVSDKENKEFMEGMTNTIVFIIAVLMLIFMVSFVWKVFNDYKSLVSEIYNTFEYIAGS